jgi:Reverse transcriptase (RNA-dependent DNA polymerase).
MQYPKGINLTKQNSIKTILFADGQVLLAESEDDFQRTMTLMNEIVKEYDTKISPEKTQLMAMQGKYTRRVTLVVDKEVPTAVII